MRKTKLFLLPIAVILLISLGIIVFLRFPGSEVFISAAVNTVSVSPSPEPTPEIKTVTVNYLTPIGTINGNPVNVGEIVKIEKAPEIENYTFLYWTDAQGNIETSNEIIPDSDVWYSAVYTVALNCDDHIAYLSADENGLLNLDGSVSRREFSEILYSLLKVKISAAEGFDDVSVSDTCYSATAALKSLGVISGSSFSPDNSLIWRDALTMLCALYPNSGDFSDAAICSNASALGWIIAEDSADGYLDRAITRAELAALLNSVLGRSFNGEYPDGEFETRGENYRNMLEACTIHSYHTENGVEKWTEYQPLDEINPGFMLVNYTLYYVNENHTFLRNGDINGFNFDSEGRYTSGDSELDELVRDVILQYAQDDDDMIGLLHRIFNHLAFDSTFISSKHFYSIEEIPTAELAKRFLAEAKGNCYNYSAAFIQIVRSLGYDAQWVIGNVRGEPYIIEHGWVKMPVDGEFFYFDPEMEPICRPKGLTAFMMTEQRARELGFLIVAGKD